MRNKHKFNVKKTIICPFKNCGQEFDKTFSVEYITNQKGDVIEQRII